jgi:hypothetical protein
MSTRIRLGIGIGLIAVVLVLIAGRLFRMPWSTQPGMNTYLLRSEEEPESFVEFRIVELKPSQRDGGMPMRLWDATYPSASGAAHFEFAIALREPTPDDEFPGTRGVLTAREDSSPEGLLSALAGAHHAERALRAIGESSKSRTREVPFEAAVFGTALTRGSGSRILAGEFTSDRS